jgi:hypothetical protein
MWRSGSPGKQARSFLKKRTKKLFPVCAQENRVQTGKVFLLLFLQKKKNP